MSTPCFLENQIYNVDKVLIIELNEYVECFEIQS